VSQSGSTMMRNPANYASATAKSFQQTASEQSTMDQMAQSTGGKAFVNTNALKEAIGKAVEAGSNYYTMAYTPENRDWNGSFRKITVKVNKPGVSLAYRRGYFADDPNKPAHKNAQENALSNTTQYNPLRAAMMRGGPDPTQLIFVAKVQPSTGATEDAAAQGNQPGKKAKGPFRRYTVSFLANPNQVECAVGADGMHHCELEFLTFVYDQDGALVNMQANGINAGIADAKFAEAMKTNLNYRQQISVPAKGEYTLRIGMRDRTTGNVGALEVPIAAVVKLTPAEQPSPAAGATPGAAQPANGSAEAPAK
jgi:hypothetical protein